MDGVSVQPMRLKVLYTFDFEHKNNHLARYPQQLDIQTAFLDDAYQIGVVDLKSCLDAVLEASPELHSNVENDYTIYAYDYSEPDTPLVGQGLLSKKLEGDNADIDGENMVTGRVTKNLMGLFTKNAQETLEVKLRFNPVAQGSDLRRQRSGSVSNQDVRSWSQSLERPASPMDSSGLENMQRLLSERGQQRDRAGSFSGPEPMYNRPSSRPGSRPGTPTLSQFNPPQRQPETRPASRTEIHPMPYARSDSFNSGYYSAEEAIEDGPSRKRARITKVNYPTRSDLNIERQSDSLRVAASTASSVRLHRPIPVNPALAMDMTPSAEETVRPPTPVPQAKAPRGRPRKKPRSNLNQPSMTRQSSPAIDSGIGISELPDVSMSSPEDVRPRSVSSTPANMPSSPPVMHAPMASSPRLPDLPGDHDSGFMSSHFDDIFNDEDVLQFDEFIQDDPDQGILDHQSHPSLDRVDHIFNASVNIYNEHGHQESAVNDAASQDTPFIKPLVPAPAKTSTAAPMLLPKPPTNPDCSSAPQLNRRVSGLPKAPASDPPARTFHRASTWTGTMSDIPTSDAPTGEDKTSRRSSRKRVGKEQTKARLEAAIASGEMPPFCDNCGAIETPAWRRAFRKDFRCSWEDIDTTLEDGGMHYKEAVEMNDDGTIKMFKGYKLNRRDEDSEEEWKAVTLCNPCGLWFHKQKCMRPQEKWNKRDPTQKRRRRPRYPPRIMPNSSSHPPTAKSDAVTPVSDGSSPGDTATEAADDLDQAEDRENGSNEPELPPLLTRRAGSAEPTGRLGLSQAIQNRRLTRSSPTRPPGESEDQPIDLDQMQKSVRRQLFPSPNKARSDPFPSGNHKPSENLPSFVRRSPRLNRTKNVFAEADMGQLEANALKPPSTPGGTQTSVFKTPKRAFGAEVSLNVQRTPKTGDPTVASISIGLNNTPAKMTPFTRSIHESLQNVPLNLEDPFGADGTNPSALDWPDLPPLSGSSPMSSNPIFQFDLSELTTELHTDFNDFLSTDIPMPSSPPAAFFDTGNDISTRYSGLNELSPMKGNGQVLRRSPRKNV